jgi:Ca2+-binding RTX toxin-like protein
MFEFLESRRLMSASALQAPSDVSLGGGDHDAMEISGTNGPDYIRVFSAGGGQVGIQVNGMGAVYPPALVTDHIVIRGLIGNDVIDCDDDFLTQTFTIYGGAGHDTIDGGPNADLIFGGNGTTLFLAEIADDHIDGNGGADEIHASHRGSESQLVGGDDNDVIFGSMGQDVIWGGGGHDEIWAFGNNDMIYGGANSDEIHCGDGSDIVYGEGGDDEIWGDGGNDFLYGDSGEDVIHGGTGNDSLWGDDDDDQLFGDEGDDILRGMAGNDDLDGGPGNDNNMQ